MCQRKNLLSRWIRSRNLCVISTGEKCNSFPSSRRKQWSSVRTKLPGLRKRRMCLKKWQGLRSGNHSVHFLSWEVIGKPAFTPGATTKPFPYRNAIYILQFRRTDRGLRARKRGINHPCLPISSSSESFLPILNRLNILHSNGQQIIDNGVNLEIKAISAILIFPFRSRVHSSSAGFWSNHPVLKLARTGSL